MGPGTHEWQGDILQTFSGERAGAVGGDGKDCELGVTTTPVRGAIMGVGFPVVPKSWRGGGSQGQQGLGAAPHPQIQSLPLRGPEEGVAWPWLYRPTLVMGSGLLWTWGGEASSGSTTLGAISHSVVLRTKLCCVNMATGGVLVATRPSAVAGALQHPTREPPQWGGPSTGQEPPLPKNLTREAAWLALCHPFQAQILLGSVWSVWPG